MLGIRISVIIPVYNEEKRLKKTLIEIAQYLRSQSYRSEIIVVNNGSKDRTAEMVSDLTSDLKNLRLIDNKDNRGKGFAVKQGMLEARGDYRIFTDADNSTSIDQIEKMFPLFEKGYDIVIGSRDIKGAILDPPQPWQRRMTGEGFKLYRKIILGLWGIQDTQCGFKGFTQKAAENIFSKCKIEGFSFDPEVLLIAQKLGFKIKEIPVYWKNDPDSKVKISSMIKMALDLLKIKWNLITKKYFQ